MTLLASLTSIFLMKIENSLHVVDARNLYLKWNDDQLKRLLDSLSDEVCSAIQLIPLLLHINNRFLPGYVSLDVPSGIYSYSPNQLVLKNAALINKKFNYQDEGKIKNSAIDAVFMQKKLIDGKVNLWVFKDTSLNKNKSELLDEKLGKISRWISSQGIVLNFVVLTSSDFREYAEYRGNEKKSIFLDYFYSEAVLLAGKYPLWWLVPPDKNNEYKDFVEHIKQARFVDEGEYIDLGSTNDLHKADMLRYAVEQIKTVKKSAEICLVKLMIASQRCVSWPNIDGISIRLKNNLYQSKGTVNPLYIISDMMKETFDRRENNKHKYKPIRMFSKLKGLSESLNPDVLDAFLGDDYYREGSISGVDNVISYLNLFKSISHEIKEVFSEIVNTCNLENSVDEFDKRLNVVVKNMQNFLSDNSDRVPIYNNKESNDIVLDRMKLKHELSNDIDKWSLVLLEPEGNERVIEGFNNLLALLAWCWLNRLVNRLTQISISCPQQQVKQIEARYMLDILMHGINPQLISDVPAEAFDNLVRPLQSVLFLNYMLDKNRKSPLLSTHNNIPDLARVSPDRVVYCEQLVIDSWGDAYTKQYIGNMGVLKCLCDWTDYSPIDSLSRPQRLEVFGHGTGDSTYMAQRVNQIYSEMISFFYQGRSVESRFFLRLESDYYMVRVEDGLLMPDKIGVKSNLIEYLEKPLSCFSPGMIESMAVLDEPLKEIYQINKENVLQVYFKISNRRAYCWVIDERGSLWRDVIEDIDRDSFVTHWLYFFRNTRNRLKEIFHQGKEFPGLEIKQISTNQLGGLEFYMIDSASLSGAKSFIDVQVTIETYDEVDQLSLMCDGRRFSYRDFKHNALIECVQYISSKILIGGRVPIYVTDIAIPLRLFNITQRDEIQISHVLKFKRAFEKRIYKLLEVS